ncbi:MAG: FtsB family cell division protein [Candidatus Altimarinota bacterium]
MALKLHPTTNIAKLIIIVELVLVVYLLNTLTVSVYRGYQIDQVIQNFEDENQRIEDENRQKAEDYDYYTSDNYIEKIAKQNLGLVNPGEEVIIIPGVTSSATVDPNSSDPNRIDLSDLENQEKWWIFFFDRIGSIG